MRFGAKDPLLPEARPAIERNRDVMCGELTGVLNYLTGAKATEEIIIYNQAPQFCTPPELFADACELKTIEGPSVSFACSKVWRKTETIRFWPEGQTGDVGKNTGKRIYKRGGSSKKMETSAGVASANLCDSNGALQFTEQDSKTKSMTAKIEGMPDVLNGKVYHQLADIITRNAGTQDWASIAKDVKKVQGVTLAVAKELQSIAQYVKTRVEAENTDEDELKDKAWGSMGGKVKAVQDKVDEAVKALAEAVDTNISAENWSLVKANIELAQDEVKKAVDALENLENAFKNKDLKLVGAKVSEAQKKIGQTVKVLQADLKADGYKFDEPSAKKQKERILTKGSSFNHYDLDKDGIADPAYYFAAGKDVFMPEGQASLLKETCANQTDWQTAHVASIKHYIVFSSSANCGDIVVYELALDNVRLTKQGSNVSQ